MKMVRIFVEGKDEEGIWAIQRPALVQNEWELFLEKINNVQWLHNFFEKHQTDLYSGFFRYMSIEDAVWKTLDEVEEMEDALYHYAKRGFSDDGSAIGDQVNTFNDRGICLQHLFKPLNNHEYIISAHQKSKARIRNGWVRLYAIRLAANCYVITGGAIKLCQHMNREYLQLELKKLEQAKTFLRNNGIDFPEDLKIHRDE